MKAGFKAAFLIGCMLLPGVNISAQAQTASTAVPVGPFIRYSIHQSETTSPSYQLAAENMVNAFKGSRYDRNEPGSIVKPIIGLSDFDLNGDKLPEIIGYPVENVEEVGTICKPNRICPHYILEVRNKSVKNLGIIWADYLDSGPDIVNGHWTLLASFRHNPVKAMQTCVDKYKYEPAKDAYVRENTGRKPCVP